MNITQHDILNMEDNSRTRNHFKYRLRYHVIFSTKFRKKILEPIKDDVFAAFDYAIYNAKFSILTKNIDKYKIFSHFSRQNNKKPDAKSCTRLEINVLISDILNK